MEHLIPFLFMSQDAEWLLYKLKKQLFDKESSFRKIVIVPNSLVKNKLYDRLLDDKISTGFKVLELPAAIDYLMRLVDLEDRHNHAFPAPILLSLHLEILIQDLINEKELPIGYSFDSLFKYLKESRSEKLRVKIQDLSDALSKEFLHYGMYGSEGLKKWFEKKGWQSYLWEKAFTSWDYPYKLFEQGKIFNPLNIQMEIHVFGFSFIPKIYEKFFQKLASFFQFHEYYLSPCRTFWGDICSEKERFFLKRLHEKRGVRQEEIIELDSYLKTRNTLLANFGKQTQKRYNILLDREYPSEEMFSAPEREIEQKTLLEALQWDLSEGVVFEEREKILLKEEDFSIQIHQAPSKKREVEVLLSVLMDLTYRHDIKPSEILVLAPNISEYFPFIYQSFDAESPFPIEVHDLEILSQSQFLQGFWHILCLEELRWEQKDIFKLFMLDPFLKKMQIGQEEVSKIKRWCEVAQIKWGYNQKHRNEKVGFIDSEEKMLEDSEVGTWKYGLERLLFGLVNIEEMIKEKELLHYFPLEEVDMKDATLLGDFIVVVERLYEDSRLFSHAQISLLEWVNVFKRVAESYFSIEVSGKINSHKRDSEKQAFDFFIEQLKVLLQLSNKVVDKKYPFSSLKRYFEKAFRKKGAVFSEANKEAICFASLKSQQFYPTKVIYLLGMEEDSFPRPSEVFPLREIEDADMDPSPKTIEEDRQILLDILLYAKQNIVISYCNADIKDGKEKNPSFLIEELIEHCDQHYCYPGSKKKPSEKIIYSHKNMAFHKKEWSLENPFLNFSFRNYRLAQTYYYEEKQDPIFIPEFYGSDSKLQSCSSSNKTEYKVTINDLKVFARNPLQHYFNHALGVYLRKEDSEEQRLSKEFIMNSLDKALFRIENFNKDFEEAYEKLDLLGELPLGIFKEIARDQLQKERDILLENFSGFGLDFSDVMTIELSSSCLEPFQKKNQNWVVPSLKFSIEEEIFYIEGLLENVCKQGLIFYGKNSFQEVIKIWPIYLVFCCIASKYFPEIETTLLFGKEGAMKQYEQQEIIKHLEKYLSYYKKAMYTPSPLLPIWSEAIILKSKEEASKAITKSFTGDARLQMQLLDDYQKWSFDHLEPFCAHTLHNLWHTEFQKTFKPLVEWYDKEVYNA